MSTDQSSITDYYSTNTDNKRPLSSSSNESDQPRKKMCTTEDLSAVTSVLSRLTEKIDAIAEKQAEISEIKTAVSFISDQFEQMRIEREADRRQIAALKSENVELKEKVGEMEHQIDCNQQYSRRNCLVVHGLTDDQGTTDDRVIK